MPLYYPSILKNSNPAYALVDATELRGNAYLTGSDGEQYGIPIDKRQLGMIVYFSSSQDYKYYKGGTTSSADWSSPLSWSMFGGGATYNQGPGIIIDANNYISASLGYGLEFSSSYIQANLGSGLNFDGSNQIRTDIYTVNGQTPDPITRNIATALTATLVGPSASNSPNNLIGSSSGDVTGSIADGTVWIVANDSSLPTPNGQAWIFVSQSIGKWYPLDTLNQTQADLMYVKLSSNTLQSITSSLLITGSSTTSVTFSSSIYWISKSFADFPASTVTASVVVLGNDNKLYITGSYGAGGGTTVKAGAISPTAFSGNPRTYTVTFNTAFSNTNYGISVIGGDARSWTIDNKLSGQFTINTNSSVALQYSASWIASPENNP